VTSRFDAIVIGAGFSGLYALHRLRELGCEGASSRLPRTSVGHGCSTGTRARGVTSRCAAISGGELYWHDGGHVGHLFARGVQRASETFLGAFSEQASGRSPE
jgi:hypothetical protein